MCAPQAWTSTNKRIEVGAALHISVEGMKQLSWRVSACNDRQNDCKRKLVDWLEKMATDTLGSANSALVKYVARQQCIDQSSCMPASSQLGTADSAVMQNVMTASLLISNLNADADHILITGSDIPDEQARHNKSAYSARHAHHHSASSLAETQLLSSACPPPQIEQGSLPERFGGQSQHHHPQHYPLTSAIARGPMHGLLVQPGLSLCASRHLAHSYWS